MKEYSTIKRGNEYDPNKYTYYLFDMDGDGDLELCIRNVSTYIFKYDIETKAMILWLSIGSPYERIHGTQALRWDWEEVRHRICKLNENGEIVFTYIFWKKQLIAMEK